MLQVYTSWAPCAEQPVVATNGGSGLLDITLWQASDYKRWLPGSALTSRQRTLLLEAPRTRVPPWYSCRERETLSPAVPSHSAGVGTPSRAIRTWETSLTLWHTCCSLPLQLRMPARGAATPVIDSDAVVRAYA